MPLRALVVVLLGSLMAGACASSGKPEPSANPPYEAMAAERFGAAAPVDYLPNAPETHVLVVYRPKATAGQPVAVTSYFVYDVAAGRIVFEEQGVSGSVAWRDDRHLRVRLTPGIVPRDGEEPPASYLVDVYTGKRAADTE